MRRSWVALQRHDGIKQILIVLGAFWAYELTRMFVQPNWSAAMANARKVDGLERGLKVAWEQSVQQTFLRGRSGARCGLFRGQSAEAGPPKAD